MSFVDRAHSMHDRGDVFAAAVTLASGLKRTPDHEDALDWFLSLYLEELPNPGLERELLQVLERRPDGGERFGVLLAELEHIERDDKIEALHIALERHRIRLPIPRVVGEPEAAAPEAGPVEPPAERWDRFESPLDASGESHAVPPPPGARGATPSHGASDDADADDADDDSTATSAASDDAGGPVDPFGGDDRRVRYVDAEDVPPAPRRTSVPHALLLGVALIVAAALMVWVALASDPPASETPFEPTVGSGEGL